MVKPNATALRRFKSQIESETNKKIGEVKAKYPDKAFHPLICVKNGKGRIRSVSEIRSLLPKEFSTWERNISAEIVFDLEKEKVQFEETQKKIVTKRESIIAKINKESEDIINKAYFGEGELSEFLKEFSEKKYL